MSSIDLEVTGDRSAVHFGDLIVEAHVEGVQIEVLKVLVDTGSAHHLIGPRSQVDGRDIALIPARRDEAVVGFGGQTRTDTFLANLRLPDGAVYERVVVKLVSDDACNKEWCLGLPVLADYDLFLASGRPSGSHMRRPPKAGLAPVG